MKFLATTITAVAALATMSIVALKPQPAAAQWYASGQGGVNMLSDADNREAGVSIESSHDTGWLVGGAIGRRFPGGLRAEGEVAYRRNSLDTLTVTNDGGIGVALGVGSLNGLSLDAEGNVSALSFMLNLFYDFSTGVGIVPYLGGGVGLARVSANDVKVLGVTVVDDSDTVFAFQIGAGLSFPITPAADLFVDYRYFRTADPRLTDTTGASFDSEYQSHSISGGVRVKF